MSGEEVNQPENSPPEQMPWGSWEGPGRSQQFGKLPNDVLVTAWFVAFIPVVAVFLIWLSLYLRSHAGNSNTGYPQGPQYGYTPYSAPYQPYTSYPSAYPETQESSQPPPSSAAADPTSQASAIEQVLQQTETDRKSAAAAVADLANCGASDGLSADVNTLQMTRTDRASLAGQLQNDLVDQLSGGAQAEQLLETALQDSATSDSDYSQAGQDFANNPSSCTASAITQDSNFVAGQNEDKTATADKTSFTTAWNPIAQQYGLQQWDQSQF